MIVNIESQYSKFARQSWLNYLSLTDEVLRSLEKTGQVYKSISKRSIHFLQCASSRTESPNIRRQIVSAEQHFAENLAVLLRKSILGPADIALWLLFLDDSLDFFDVVLLVDSLLDYLIKFCNYSYISEILCRPSIFN